MVNIIICFEVNEKNGNIFTTSSCDTNVKLWDILKRLCTIAVSSEDSLLCLYDLRVFHNLGIYYKNKGDITALDLLGIIKSRQIIINFLFGSCLKGKSVLYI